MSTNDVLLVLDPDLGADLAPQVQGRAVWIVESDSNREAATRAREEGVDVTVFRGPVDEDSSVQRVYDIDLHHGVHSSGSDLAGIEVLGGEITTELERAMAEVGLTQVTKTERGLRARKP